MRELWESAGGSKVKESNTFCGAECDETIVPGSIKNVVENTYRERYK